MSSNLIVPLTLLVNMVVYTMTRHIINNNLLWYIKQTLQVSVSVAITENTHLLPQKHV